MLRGVEIVITLGIDFAASPKKTACCLIDWTSSTITHLDRLLDDREIVELIDRSADVTAIDIPLGWPTGFVEAIADHSAGRSWPDDPDRTALRFRETDRVLIAQGINPLSVSSDRIGVGAMRGARIQSMLSAGGVDVDRSGTSGKLVEAYPAAALRSWGLPWRGYKGTDNRAALANLAREVAASCGAFADTVTNSLQSADDDAFDALICALVGTASTLGLTTKPTADQMEAAGREGWIHVPTAPLGDIVAATRAGTDRPLRGPEREPS